LDTSKFDKAVKKLKWNKETASRLEKWLADTAHGASNKAGKDITPDMIKVSCSNRFEEFLAKFKEWQDVNYPPGSVAGIVTQPDSTVTGATDTEEKGDPVTPPPDAPNMVNLVEQLATRGWPVEKLQIKFGKPMADWTEKELSMLADLAAETP
jgi:hypothetical protein